MIFLEKEMRALSILPVDSPGKDGNIFAFHSDTITANKNNMFRINSPINVTYDSVEVRTSKNFHNEIIISTHISEW